MVHVHVSMYADACMTSSKIKCMHDQFEPNSQIQFKFPLRPNLSVIFQPTKKLHVYVYDEH
jgi:hypothetical protein